MEEERLAIAPAAVPLGKVVRLARSQPVVVDPPPAAQRRPAGPPPSELLARLAMLERATVFFAHDAATLRVIARRARRMAAAAGTSLLVQGEYSDCIFVIGRGHCVLRQESAPGHSVVVAVLGPGDIFGEDAFLSGEASRISATASGDVDVLLVDRSAVYGAGAPAAGLIEDLGRFADERKATFAAMLAQSEWDKLTDGATVVCLYSPKGGTGRTTLALNLVASLARQRPREVLLLDLAFPYPHASLVASLVPGGCLARLRDTPPELFEEALLSIVLYHPTGLMVLPGALQPEQADLVTGDLVARAVDVLRRSFRYIVVDLPVAMSEVTLAAFDQAQHILMVVTPEITAVKGAADAGAILEMLGTPPDRIALILNHRTPSSTLSARAVERGAGRAVADEVGYDGARPDEAAVHGAILALTNPKSEIARAAHRLAATLEARHGGAADLVGAEVHPA